MEKLQKMEDNYEEVAMEIDSDSPSMCTFSNMYSRKKPVVDIPYK